LGRSGHDGAKRATRKLIILTYHAREDRLGVDTLAHLPGVRGTRCCDSSPNRHPSKHAHATKHPVIASAEPGERWLYCYPDDAFAEY